MAYIFMDESGCLGLDLSKAGTSKHFLVTFVFAASKRPLEKIIRSRFHVMTQTERKRLEGGVLHCTKASPRVRLKLLHDLRARRDVSVMLIRLDKRRVYTPLQDEQAVLYNYVTNILLDRIITKKLIPLDEPVHLVASRRQTSRFLNENFKAYLMQRNANAPVKLSVEIRTPAQEKALQVADFVSWSAFRHYEHGDSSYYDVIRELVVEDSPLYGA